MTEFAPSPATNGKGAAAIMAVAIGSLALGVFTITGDTFPAAAAFFNVWTPTGPLSGVTGLAILIWLLAWWLLARIWGPRELKLRHVNWVAALVILAGLLLTFPPFMDFLQGK
jgi:cytochrome bd-type quinol oxidase subunit 2